MAAHVCWKYVSGQGYDAWILATMGISGKEMLIDKNIDPLKLQQCRTGPAVKRAGKYPLQQNIFQSICSGGHVLLSEYD